MEELATFCRVDAPDVARLHVSGEIDLAVAGTFAAAVKALVDTGTPTVTIDLRRVTFFNSTGIGVLCDAADSARRRQVVLIVEPSEHVRRTLEITGLTGNFDLR
jgi:anti-sigma B factor antagonist